MYCYSETPPDLEESAFKDAYIEYATLYVPPLSLEQYKKTEPWNKFGTIDAIPSGSYTLTYKVNGEVFLTANYELGEIIIPESAPKRDGYVFSGWSKIPVAMPNHDVTVEGFWVDPLNTKKAYTFQNKQNGYYMTLSDDGISISETPCELTFKEAGGGKYYITDGEYYVGLAGTDGWSMSSSPEKKEALTIATTIVDGQVYYTLGESLGMVGVDWPQKDNMGCWADKKTNDGDAVLWIVTGVGIVNKYTLTYMVDGKTYKTMVLEDGAVVPIEIEPTKEGCTFSGWSEIPSTMPANDVTVTGLFTPNKYNLIYKVDGEIYKSYEVEFGKSISAEAGPTKKNYAFSGWSEIPETMPAHDVTVTGSFTRVSLVASYKRNLSSQTTGTSSMIIGSYVKKSVGFNLVNKGTESINVTKLVVKDASNYAVVSSSTDTSLLGTLPAGQSIELSVNLTSDITTCYEWHYTYKGQEFVFCSDANDPAMKHDVTFYVDGDILVTYEYDQGDEIIPEEEPAKEGYTFSGWSEIPATMPNKNVTVKGTFTVNTYTLAYEVDGEAVKTSKVKYGKSITAKEKPQKEGYTFVASDEEPSTMPAKDVTIKGTFVVNKYNLTYKVDGEITKTSEVEYGTALTAEAEPTKEGYTFSGWSEIPATMPAKDLTITGKFSINKYTLTYIVDGETHKTLNVKYGATIAAENAPEKEGYTFSGWGEIPATMPAKDVTVTGSFTVNKYRLTYIVDGATYSTTGVEYGATITSEDEPTKEGYTFSGWSETPATMPAKDVTVTGSFTPNKYTLTYMVDGEVYKTYEVEYGASITPEVDPVKEGYTFSGWGEIPATMPAKDVTVTGSFTEVVVFDTAKTYSFQSKQNEYYMTLSADGISIAEEPCALRFEEAGDGKYYITDGEYYVGLAGTDGWSMTSAPVMKEALGISSTIIGGETYYSFSESLGMVGVDWPKKDNMGCWADKKTSDGDAVLWLVKEMEVVDAIADVKATEGDYQIYTIDGKAISTLQKGVNIIRYSNGKVKKVVVK